MINKIGKSTFGVLIYLLLSSVVVAQIGHKIEINVKNYASQELVLAHEFLNRYPVIDTLEAIAPGTFVHESTEPLPAGVYLAVLQPENEFISFIVDIDDQHFTVSGDAAQLYNPTHFENSMYNDIYQSYVQYSNESVSRLNDLNDQLRKEIDETTRAYLMKKFSGELEVLTTDRQKYIDKAPKSLAAQLIRMEIETVVPTFEGSEQEVLNQKFFFRKDHYFDHLNLADERLLNTESLFNKVFYFLEQLTPQNIASINESIDEVLLKMKPGKNFKYYLDHIMLEYASSDYIGMDAVYVHVVDNYYAKGMADWVDKNDLAEMLEDVRKRRPLLMGKPAPKIDMELEDGAPIALYDVDAPITILYLWQPNCSHCKASTPHMKAFWEKYKSTGLQIFSGCTKVGAKTDDCWAYIKGNDLGGWINTVDKDLSSRFVQKYMAEKTPKIFILDADKKIILKDVDAEQLEEIMPVLIETERLAKPGTVIKS